MLPQAVHSPGVTITYVNLSPHCHTSLIFSLMREYTGRKNMLLPRLSSLKKQVPAFKISCSLSIVAAGSAAQYCCREESFLTCPAVRAASAVVRGLHGVTNASQASFKCVTDTTNNNEATVDMRRRMLEWKPCNLRSCCFVQTVKSVVTRRSVFCLFSPSTRSSAAPWYLNQA